MNNINMNRIINMNHIDIMNHINRHVDNIDSTIVCLFIKIYCNAIRKVIIKMMTVMMMMITMMITLIIITYHLFN